MKKKIFKRTNKKELTKHRASVVGLMYNEITEGEFKGMYTSSEIVNKENINMSVWTKEQSEDLDKRFGGVNTRLDSLEADMKEVKSDIKNMKLDIKNMKLDIENIKSAIENILEMIVSMNKKLDAK